MSRSYPALGRCCPADPKTLHAHECSGPHIPYKTRNMSREPTIGRRVGPFKESKMPLTDNVSGVS